jgi:hypothetical protein
VIGLLLADALPLLDPALELELLDPPHATTVAIAANASALATQLRKILISVSSAPQWVPRGTCVGLHRNVATDVVASCWRRAPGSADTDAVQSFAGP